MKKIDQKSRVLKINRETITHLTAHGLRQVVGGSNISKCVPCGGTTTIHTDSEDYDSQKH